MVCFLEQAAYFANDGHFLRVVFPGLRNGEVFCRFVEEDAGMLCIVAHHNNRHSLAFVRAEDRFPQEDSKADAFFEIHQVQ